MAYCVNDPKVGQHVYRHGLPLKAGTIIEVYLYGSVRILWVSGETTLEWTLELRDFDALIADHQKKLNTHLQTLKKLEELWPNLSTPAQ